MSTDVKVTPRLKAQYREEIVAALTTEFQFANAIPVMCSVAPSPKFVAKFTTFVGVAVTSGVASLAPFALIATTEKS